VAVGDVQLIGLGIDKYLGGQAQILGVVAALAGAGLADTHQEFALLGELQNHAVVIQRRTAASRSGLAFRGLFGLLDLVSRGECRSAGGVLSGSGSGAWRRSRRAPVAADPDVALVIDGDAVVRGRPLVTRTV